MKTNQDKWSKLLNRFERCNQYIQINKKAFFKNFGITSNQYDVLKVLSESDDALNVNQIKTRVVYKDADISRLTDRLLKMGFVKKKSFKIDRRVSLTSLTKSGILVVQKIDRELHKLDEIFFELSNKDVKTLNKLLKKLLP